MIRRRYNLGERRGAVTFTAPSLCQSQFLASTSIDSMIKRAVMGDTSVFRKPQYYDVLACPDSFHDAMNRSAFAASVWHDLPESVKQAYGSPERLLAEYERQLAERANDVPVDKPVDKESPKPVTADKADESSTDSAHA